MVLTKRCRYHYHTPLHNYNKSKGGQKSSYLFILLMYLLILTSTLLFVQNRDCIGSLQCLKHHVPEGLYVHLLPHVHVSREGFVSHVVDVTDGLATTVPQ